MEYTFSEVMDSGQTIQLIGLLAAALFFTAVAIKELSNERSEGLLYIALSVFFGIAHAYFLMNVMPGSALAVITSDLSLFGWLSTFLAPALIVLFISFGIFAAVINQRQAAIVKIFFGLTLLCYLYMLGTDWPLDVRGIITLTWALTWISLEFSTAQ